VQNLQKLDRGLISKNHRGFFPKFPKILINELFSNGKGCGPGPRVRGTAGRAQSTVDRRQRGQRGGPGVAARSPEYGLRPLRCTKAHRWGHNRERGARGARLGPHRSSCDGGAEPEAAALGEREARAWREAKRGWEWCGELWGWCSPFIGGRGVNASVNGFNAIEDRGGFRRGIKGGKMKARW
jgi:hypothetical protein